MQPLDMESCNFALTMKENQSTESMAQYQQRGNAQKAQQDAKFSR